jgi:hypothetical protein
MALLAGPARPTPSGHPPAREHLDAVVPTRKRSPSIDARLNDTIEELHELTVATTG